MPVLDLRSGPLSLRVSTVGGSILGFWAEREGERVALLREAPIHAEAMSSACYPLVPFGNRVRDNRFVFAGEEFCLLPNTDWDRHYLHGDGWQADWRLDLQADNRVEMSYAHEAQANPYSYRAKQIFTLGDGGLHRTLSVQNTGSIALPFGLGWHPYFSLTPGTTLFAPAQKYWTEAEAWLPGEVSDIPDELDFSKAAPLPKRWVNNGYEGWAGNAVITWPERRMKLHLTAEPLFRHAFLFVSDASFDPGFTRDYFCFEPMSHLANGHNMANLGELEILEPGQHLSGSICLEPLEL